MPEPNNPWKTLDSRVVHESRWLTVYEDNVITPSGKPGKYTYVQSPPFVLVIGHDGGHFIMVRQYRYPIKRVMTEFAGGSIDGDETPLAAAKREFQEETGFVADRWTEIGTLHNPNPATVFLAEGLTETDIARQNEDGIADVIRLTWGQIDEAIKNGAFTDSKTLAALMLFQRYRTGS